MRPGQDSNLRLPACKAQAHNLSATRSHTDHPTPYGWGDSLFSYTITMVLNG